MPAHLASVFVAILLAAVPLEVFFKFSLVVLERCINHVLKDSIIHVFIFTTPAFGPPVSVIVRVKCS